MTIAVKKKRKRGRPRKLVHYAIVKRQSRKEYCTVHDQWLTVQYTYRTNHPVERITFCVMCNAETIKFADKLENEQVSLQEDLGTYFKDFKWHKPTQ